MRVSALSVVVLAALVGVCYGSLSLAENPNYIVAVLGASSPSFRLQAWFHTDHGLVLLDTPRSAEFANATALWPAAFERLLSATRRSVNLGTEAALPAFDDNGDLYFERSTSADGKTIEFSEEWVLSFKHRNPMPVSGDEGVPQVIKDRRVAAKEAAVAAAQAGEKKGFAAAPFKITIDAGHGGSDPGAVAQGYEEEFFNRDVSNRLRDLLVNDRGLWTIQMCRTTDVTVSLTARTNMANAWPADRFVSVHTNSFSSSTATGTETFAYAEGGNAAQLRDLIQSEMVKAWGLANRGGKTGDLHVLRETTMPATLSEMGFITSPTDIKKLSDPNARQQMAAAHLYALRRHYGVLPAEEE